MSQNHASELVEHIYDAIVDEDSLQSLPAALAAFTKCDGSWIAGDLSFGTDAPGRPIITCVHGFDPDIIRSYEANEHLNDPWLAAGPQIQLGRAVSLARHVTETAFRASVMYNEFVRGRADVMHCMALAVPTKGRIIAYAFHRGATSNAFNDRDEQQLEILRPHLVRLLRARQLRRENQISGATAFDHLLIGPDAVYLCDDEARVMHLNVPASDLLTQRSVFCTSSCGRLEAVGSQMNLHHAVRDAVSRGVPTLHVATQVGHRWMIRVDPAHDGSKIAVVLVRDIDAYTKRQVQAAAFRFGFTSAETSLADSLAHGMTVEHHAALRNIKMPTVRSQMSSLLAKSGCERQAQLVSVIHETLPGR